MTQWLVQVCYRGRGRDYDLDHCIRRLLRRYPDVQSYRWDSRSLQFEYVRPLAAERAARRLRALRRSGWAWRVTLVDLRRRT